MIRGPTASPRGGRLAAPPTIVRWTSTRCAHGPRTGWIRKSSTPGRAGTQSLPPSGGRNRWRARPIHDASQEARVLDRGAIARRRAGPPAGSRRRSSGPADPFVAGPPGGHPGAGRGGRGRGRPALVIGGGGPDGSVVLPVPGRTGLCGERRRPGGRTSGDADRGRLAADAGRFRADRGRRTARGMRRSARRDRGGAAPGARLRHRLREGAARQGAHRASGRAVAGPPRCIRCSGPTRMSSMAAMCWSWMSAGRRTRTRPPPSSPARWPRSSASRWRSTIR